MNKIFVMQLVLAMSSLLYAMSGSTAEKYPTNRDDLIGPTWRTDANADGFFIKRAPAADGALQVKIPTYCAPRNSSLIVTERKDNETWVKFHGLGTPGNANEIAAFKLICGSHERTVLFDIVYAIPDEQFDAIPLRASGVGYGALVVPFKFRLGKDKKISSSATIAPYIGLRWHRLQRWGVEVMPIATAGLALVPINDPVTNDSSTKAAFSTAVGITLNSTTQKNFSAGILFGKDFLGKKDRMLDPSVNKPWISIWLGTAQ